VIDPDTCLECGACVPACPLGAIYQADLPVQIDRAPVHSQGTQQSLPVEAASSSLAPWFGTAVAFMGREIVPRIAEALIATLERRLSRPGSLPATISQPMALQSRSSAGRPRRQRRRVGWR